MSTRGTSEQKVVNIASFLAPMAQERPDEVAIYFPEGRDASGRREYSTYTYAQLEEASSRIARGLEMIGIGRGVRTVLMVKPSLEFFALTFGIFKAGAVPVMIDPGMGLPNVKTCLAEAEPQAFIGIPAAHLARKLLGWGKGTIQTHLTVGKKPLGGLLWGGKTLEELKELAGSPRQHPDWKMAATEADDTAAILFTSGSTGVPKGAVYRHATFTAQVDAIREMYGIEPGEIDLPTFPLFALFDPALGMASVIPDMDFSRPAKADPELLMEAIEQFGVTNMFGSPALLETLSRRGRGGRPPLGSVRRIISAGAPVPAALQRRTLAMFSPEAQIVTPYGATESLPVATISSREVLAETAELTDQGHGVCVGRPVSGIELEIIAIDEAPIPHKEDAQRLEVGEIGEVVVCGEVVTHSYYGREASTQQAKMKDQKGRIWHRMGDLGRLDDQGRLWFYGRKSHRVQTDQELLFTVPCESIFNVHPWVRRTALVGVEVYGKREAALCVELEQHGVNVVVDKLIAQLRELGSGFEITRGIERFLIHPAFPVDTRHNAKIRRPELAQWAQHKIEGGQG